MRFQKTKPLQAYVLLLTFYNSLILLQKQVDFFQRYLQFKNSQMLVKFSLFIKCDVEETVRKPGHGVDETFSNYGCSKLIEAQIKIYKNTLYLQ